MRPTDLSQIPQPEKSHLHLYHISVMKQVLVQKSCGLRTMEVCTENYT